MPKLQRDKLPKYCRVKNRGFYNLDNRKIYLPGLFNSPESLKAYSTAMSDLLSRRADEAAGLSRPAVLEVSQNITVAEATSLFLAHGKDHYATVDSFSPYELASRPLIDLFGSMRVSQFRQGHLIEIQQRMIDSGLSRTVINDRISRIKQIFSWNSGRGNIDTDVAGRLKFVQNLRAGKTKARETQKRQPVEARWSQLSCEPS